MYTRCNCELFCAGHEQRVQFIGCSKQVKLGVYFVVNFASINVTNSIIPCLLFFYTTVDKHKTKSYLQFRAGSIR